MIYYCVVEIRNNRIIHLIEMVTLVGFLKCLDGAGIGIIGVGLVEVVGKCPWSWFKGGLGLEMTNLPGP